MRSLWPHLRRAPRTLMFWMIVAVFAVALLRSFFPEEGFDEVRTGEQPLEVAAGDDGVWVLNYADHSVSLVDTSTTEEVFETPVGDDVAPALAANDDGAWVLLDAGDTLGRIDPSSEDVAERIDLADAFDEGSTAQDLAAGEDFVWVTSGEGGQMLRVDTRRGEVGEPIDLGEDVVQPQVLGDSLWVFESDGLTEYDATTGEEQRKIDTSDFRVHDFVATEDHLFVLANVDNFEQTGLLVRLDLQDDGSESGRARIQESAPTHLAAAGDQVFVVGTGGILTEFESLPDRSPTPIATEQVTVSTKDLRTVIVVDETIWIADGTNGVVHQPITGIEGEVETDDTAP